MALWGFRQGRRVRCTPGPFVIGAFGAVALALGVIVVHGPPAMIMIYGGAILLVAATAWKIAARRRRVVDTSHRDASPVRGAGAVGGWPWCAAHRGHAAILERAHAGHASIRGRRASDDPDRPPQSLEPMLRFWRARPPAGSDGDERRHHGLRCRRRSARAANGARCGHCDHHLRRLHGLLRASRSPVAACCGLAASSTGAARALISDGPLERPCTASMRTINRAVQQNWISFAIPRAVQVPFGSPGETLRHSTRPPSLARTPSRATSPSPRSAPAPTPMARRSTRPASISARRSRSSSMPVARSRDRRSSAPTLSASACRRSTPRLKRFDLVRHRETHR